MIKKKADELTTSVASKEYFTGTAWITPLAAPGETTINAASVTFSPGARNNWHTSRRTDPHRHSRKRLCAEERRTGSIVITR